MTSEQAGGQAWHAEDDAEYSWVQRGDEEPPDPFAIADILNALESKAKTADLLLTALREIRELAAEFKYDLPSIWVIADATIRQAEEQ